MTPATASGASRWAEASQRGCQSGGGVAQTIGVHRRAYLIGLVGQYRRPGPALCEDLDAETFELVGKPVIGQAALPALAAVPDAWAGSDQDQVGDAVGQPEGGVARDRFDVIDHGIERDGSCLCRTTVPAQVGRDRQVAFGQRRDHGIPARPGVGEAVEEDYCRRHR
jgi:hypothetical protein